MTSQTIRVHQKLSNFLQFSVIVVSAQSYAPKPQLSWTKPQEPISTLLCSAASTTTRKSKPLLNPIWLLIFPRAYTWLKRLVFSANSQRIIIGLSLTWLTMIFSEQSWHLLKFPSEILSSRIRGTWVGSRCSTNDLQRCQASRAGHPHRHKVECQRNPRTGQVATRQT